MELLLLLGIGLLTGLTTVLFGFGGGFVTVPVMVWVDAGLGADAAHVAVATSTAVMVVNACVATAATDRSVLARLSGNPGLFGSLVLGGAAGAFAARYAPGAVTQWCFVGYLAVTIADLLLRPGFLRRGSRPRRPAAALSTALGLPIGTTAAFLGVGGSVMTVPVMRRSGHDMRTATSLANPLTLAVAAPAAVLFLVERPALDHSSAVFLLGSVDLGGAAALLAGALPIIVLLRRRPPRIPDVRYARCYLGLLVLMTVTMLAATL